MGMKLAGRVLEDCVIIGAHPDDELLWFSSILHEVDEVILIFRDFWAHPGLGPARSAAIAGYPRAAVTCLNLAEAGVYGCADWRRPVLNEFGIALGPEASRRTLAHTFRRALGRIGLGRGFPAAPQGIERMYEANYAAILKALRTRLHSGMNVFSHNPWGEYGHEEHIQLFRVLQRLREEIGFTLWMSNYCSERALPLAMRYFDSVPQQYHRLATNRDFAGKVASVYKKHGCWTWADDWMWFADECFMEAPRVESIAKPGEFLFPLNMFTIDGMAGENYWRGA